MSVNDKANNGHVRIFDTTLRDGEQAPGFSMNRREKLTMARQLARLGVDVIEAGFPASSDQDYSSVWQIAEEVGAGGRSVSICALCRTTESDIEKAWNAVSAARSPRLHVFIATSDIHLRHKLRMSRDEVLRAIERGVGLARSLCPDVEFSPEDAARTEISFLAEAISAAVATGATTINIPDTVGYTTPPEFAARLRAIRMAVEARDEVVYSVHCHDDLGLAVANSLAAVEAGARQIECTINGIGERAGNASLEEIVMALHTRADVFGVDTAVEREELYPTSRLLSHLTGTRVQPNKAIVGDNAFAHEAGIHQHGMLNERLTYEIMRPEDVGRRTTDLVLGKHSGRHALGARLDSMGFQLDTEELSRVFAEFKALTERKKSIFDDDLVALVSDQMTAMGNSYTLEYLHVLSGTAVMPSATVTIREGEEQHRGSGHGDGPVDAVINAIRSAVGVSATLRSYATHASTPGTDAVGEVVVGVELDGRTATGRGRSTDIVEAGARAYLDGLNRVLATGARVSAMEGARMGMTITEKILAAHTDADTVEPGEMIEAKVDFLMGNDITAPLAIRAFEQAGATRIFDPDRLAIVFSHFVPAKDIASANQARIARDFAERYQLRHFYGEGRGGIEHVLLPQEGLVVSGDLVIGADSHSCTYGGLGAFSTGVGSTDLAAAMITGQIWLRVPESMRFRFTGALAPWVSAKDLILHVIGQIGVDGATYRAMEFDGDTVESLSVEQRLTLCNMAIEAGGKNGIVGPDAISAEYLEGRGKRASRIYASDEDASYHSTFAWDASQIPLQVAQPYAPDRVCPIDQVTGRRVDQVFIGSCTNARMEDLRVAATLMRGHKLPRHLRCIVIPATHQIFREAASEGLIEIFMEAGCIVSESTCGPCLGGYFGVLGEGEVCVSTSNRNFPGRMGHKSAEVYLVGPAVAAATAICGEIADPNVIRTPLELMR